MSKLKLYSKFLKKKKAIDKILSDLHNPVLRELGRVPDGKISVDGAEFHTTIKRTAKYPKDIKAILDNLKTQIDEQKHVAEEAKKVTFVDKDTFDASIPKSTEKAILKTVPDTRKHFGVK